METASLLSALPLGFANGLWQLHLERQHPRWHEWLPRKLTREGLVFFQHLREGRFQRSLAFITAGSSLLAGLEVAYEHYRGSYGTSIMYSPVALSPPLIAAGLWAVVSRRATRFALPVLSALNVADGLLGFFFHVRGIARKPGGWRLPVFNLVMGPPVFAPLLFAIPGYLGLIASFLRREEDPRGDFLPRWPRRKARHSFLLGLLPGRFSRHGHSLRHELREGRFQKHLAAATAASALFSGFEALYSHYKSNFSQKVQWSPILLTPVLMAAGVGAIFSRKVAHYALPAASMLAVLNGGVGFFFHARGVLRRPGGTRYLAYNMMYGPPVFAPLLYAASGFLGLLASLMRRER